METGSSPEQPSYSGLSQQEASARLLAEGPNEVPGRQQRTFLRIAFEVLREPMFALLLAAAAVYLALGDLQEAVLLCIFATTSVAIALIQEVRTERVLEGLRDLASPRALVIRDGESHRIAGREVVRGDVLIIAEGDRVPADAHLLSCQDLLADESLLTGESVPVRKLAGTAAPDTRPGGDDLPIVFSGTLVVRGQGVAEVTATGSRSELGRIGTAIAKIETEPPRLRSETRRLVASFATVSISLSVIAVLLYGLLRGSWLEALLSGIALGMSMLPEEFPLVLTVFMVMGAWRISRAHVLTRRVAAIETLGAATVLCTDKTGTLTENRMTIAEIRTSGESWSPTANSEMPEQVRAVVETGILSSRSVPVDPMERAFHELGARQGATVSTDASPMWEYGLRPDLLAVTQVWEGAAGVPLIVAVKGAPEAVAGLCRLGHSERVTIQRAVEDMASRGMRVLAVARGAYNAHSPRPETPHAFDLKLLGVVGFADPLRPTVPAAIRDCRSAGIRVIMITGDHPRTALAVAGMAGLDTGAVLTGVDIGQIDAAEFRDRVRQTSVFARILPEQKLQIVEALKENGEIVAMTGDGVNDAPSLKAANIGIAMGGRGTDVAREAAALVLLNDDFGSIVSAIRLGRRTYDNLRKSMAYIMAVHVPIAGLAILPLLLGLPLILLPLHIAFLELVIDPVCSIVFEAEKEAPGTMLRPPRDPTEQLMTTRFIWWSVLQGLLVFAVVAVVFFAALHRGLPEADLRALTFVALVGINAGLIAVNRSSADSFRDLTIRSNPVFWSMMCAVGGLLALILSIPSLRGLFAFGPLHWDDLAAAFLAGIAGLALLVIAKRAVFPTARPIPTD